jgi:hypothetical protein
MSTWRIVSACLDMFPWSMIVDELWVYASKKCWRWAEKKHGKRVFNHGVMALDMQIDYM